VIGVGVLVGLLAADRLAPSTSLSSGPVVVLIVGSMLCAIAGAVIVLPTLLTVAGKRLPGTTRSVAWYLATRRLAVDAAATARSATGVLLLLATGMTGMGVMADLAAQNPPQPQGHTIWITPSRGIGAEALHRLLRLPARATAFEFSPPGASDWAGRDGAAPADHLMATCASIRAFATASGESTSPRALQALESQCRDGERFTVVDPDAADRGSRGGDGTGRVLRIPELYVDALSGGTTWVTRNPAGSTVGGSGTVYALPGPTEQDAERYVTDTTIRAITPCSTLLSGR
jgi:hypothetical protein